MEPKQPPAGCIELVQGTLEMLILRTLRSGSAHGHEIAKYIQRTSDDPCKLSTALCILLCTGWNSRPRSRPSSA